MPQAKLSSKSQIVIPAEIRRKLGIHPGDAVEMTLTDDVVTLRKAPGSYVERLESCASKLWQGYARDLHEERDRWEN